VSTRSLRWTVLFGSVFISTPWKTRREKHIASFFCLSDGGNADQLTSVIMHALLHEGNLSYEQIACKLVCFGANRIGTFQGPKSGVIAQIREKWAPFTLGQLRKS